MASVPVALPPASPARERLKWAESCERFPDPWVVLVELEFEGEVFSQIRPAVFAGAASDAGSLAQAAPYLASCRLSAPAHPRPSRPARDWDAEQARDPAAAAAFLCVHVFGAP